MLVSRESNLSGFLRIYEDLEVGDTLAVTKKHHADALELADALLYLASELDACLQMQQFLPLEQVQSIQVVLTALLKRLESA